MIPWFFLALGSAVTNSIYQAFSNYVVALGKFSKFAIIFYATGIGSLLLFAVSFMRGIPDIQSGFWGAVLATSTINFIAFPLILKGYEVGEFSSVYSMILLTPVFLLGTSFLMLGERPSAWGIIGVVVTVFGLSFMSWRQKKTAAISELDEHGSIQGGNLLGIFVAFLWAISVNFDKLSARYSDAFFAAAVSSAILSILNAAFLLFREQGKVSLLPNMKLRNFAVPLILGGLFGGGMLLHNSALLHGFAAYTIAIKRIGTVFGVLWGWLFFQEKDISQKLVGASIAVAGVLLIVFA